ncbi:MAG: 3-isopropylmalate dehydratase small subunit [Parvularcula sp.]|jgi:3-isopropylmalate/(R)-2-methylmalate dehydratase small subunit|nr:3-isopropylmalate dehydratase small subunit [Parvularcula sp.]
MSLEPFHRLTSRTLVLPQANIDTDQIIPARFLTAVDKNGLAQACFHDWRFGPQGEARAHPLNSVETAQTQILVTGENFGCGSSREHAPWALLAFGFRVVISTGIADIFFSNAVKNGLLPVVVEPSLHRALEQHPGEEVTVDLEAEQVVWRGEAHNFSIEPFARYCLLHGQDPLDILISALPDIEAFEREGRQG